MVRIVKPPKERKKEIISAACQLFLSKGYDNTTMKDVMVRLNIAKGTIYHYFSSKQELLEAVILSVVLEEMTRQKHYLSQTTGTSLNRIKQFVIKDISRAESRGELIDHLHKPSNAGMHIQLLAQTITSRAPLYAELIKQGCEEGVFTTDAPLECAEFLLSGIQFLTDLGICPWTADQLERRWRAFPALLESLLQAPQGSFQFLSEITHDIHQQTSTSKV